MISATRWLGVARNCSYTPCSGLAGSPMTTHRTMDRAPRPRRGSAWSRHARVEEAATAAGGAARCARRQVVEQVHDGRAIDAGVDHEVLHRWRDVDAQRAFLERAVAREQSEQ